MSPGAQEMDYISNFTLSLRATKAAKLKYLLICDTSPVACKGRFTKIKPWRSQHPSEMRRQLLKPLR